MSMYDFITGPLLWLSFAVFVIGLLVRIATFIKVSREKDKIIHQHFKWRYVLLTFARWLMPINPTVAKTPGYFLLAYVFHFCLLLVPVFLQGHIILWEESRFGWSWPALPHLLADLVTLVFIAIAALFLLRRVLSRDLRLLSDFSDYALLIITALPFLTGYWVTHGTLDAVVSRYGMQIIHTLCGELMLVMIPLSRLSHSVLFFFSRGASAVEFGRRGYSM